MAVPSLICRGKNLHLSVMKQFLMALPKQDMRKDAFYNYAESRMGGFTTTHSQIARQMGLYYCDSNDVCHVRFHEELTLGDILSYSKYWAEHYFVPNPYTPSFPPTAEPKCIYGFIQENYNNPALERDFTKFFEGLFNIPVNEGDKAKAYLLQFTNMTEDVNGKVVLPEGLPTIPVEVPLARNDTEGFYHYFDGWESSSTKTTTKRQMKQKQLIIYGAPGTGKSWRIKSATQDMNVIRTTFHPDSDYSTFVGAYKPSMKNQPRTFMKGEEIAKVSKGEASLFNEERIVYKYTAQAFLEAYVAAWRKCADYIASTDEESANKATQFLVIEEINRGNCAQIFGDIFQLLDREDDGYSSYAIKADSDLRQYLKDSFLANAEDGVLELNLTGVNLGNRDITREEIKNGSKLLLPPNLYIWATMNTSDQSLFPIDSAFKRRWEWKYMPIFNCGKNWKIKVDDSEYDWWTFLDKVNDLVHTFTGSEDKKLGYYFCKLGAEGFITLDQFVGKVVFYLWNSVFKDSEFEDDVFDDGEGGKLYFKRFFKDNGEPEPSKVKQFMKNLGVPVIGAPEEMGTNGQGSSVQA